MFVLEEREMFEGEDSQEHRVERGFYLYGLAKGGQ